MRFDHSWIPQSSHCRYFVRRGPTTYYAGRGFGSKRQFSQWMDEMRAKKRIDWQVGGLFKVYGDDLNCQLVTRHGDEVKFP